MDVSECYPSSLTSLLPNVTGALPYPCSPGVNAGPINQDFRLTRSVSGSLIPSSQQRLGMEKSMPLGSGWNSVDHGNLGLTVDPAKGGFALQGVGLPSSPIARFSSNPGFAERAARFSAFGNGHFSQSYSHSDNGSVRSGSYENENKATKLSARGEISTGGIGSPEVSGRSQANALDVGNDGEDTKSRLYRSTSAACSPAQTDEGCNAHDNERPVVGSPSESGATNGSGGQETSKTDADQGRSTAAQLSGKKRKASGDEAVKETASPVTKEQKNSGAQSKRSKGAEDKEDQKSKAERSDNSSSSSLAAKDSKHVDHPKTDYIHVRARRGQATDSHSLAERVRREKISERMKFLQDLVPGCSKVTGKAVMLDEIINYVQSIQRQVELLSMKLAAVTPRPDFNIDNFLTKQLQIGQNCGLPNMVEHTESTIQYPQLPSLHSQQSLHMQQVLSNVLDNSQSVESKLMRMNSAPPMSLPRAHMDIFGDGLSQLTGLWEGDLQSVVQMGFTQGRPMTGLGGFQCDLPPGHMKIEI
ncbi:protein MpBHLH21 [Marchantia polymorpha subsp. ruderalis]|uniref:BHLH domain-containing protein n=2 Tax=Marchantia polymorpha TaxID=3197 RepID=A0AAF6AZV8_MARPO|nr:hypothetical protein MARPO_0037s0007 [Marchantia polymorpha]BBN05292.1 hypothetical protein Mp_3g11900 [Marchantia polymorpha subsp. ruderalis]|eukprot:PTQ40812.1 hypothetical protein MARPO_0037s0007 [Marchantia polymorpha]